MQKTLLIFFCSLSFLSLGAQTKDKNADKLLKQKETVEALLDSYKFSEAAEQLQKDIAAAKKKRIDAEELEDYLDYANKGENMLTGTERVTFIDSIVVDKKNFLEVFKLSEETGSIDIFKNVFKSLSVSPEVAESYTYTPQLNDKIYFSSLSDSSLYLYTRDRLDDMWSEAVRAKGLEDFGYDQIAPFVLNDGTTMYFAAKGEQSLGGYDIFLTRFNPDENKFLRPENIGMPFNSPDNDYMYVIDESNNLGWFVSDRRQDEGNVCVYVFIPNDTRENYTLEEGDTLANFAKINAIKDTWAGRTAQVNDALNRLKNLFADTEQQTSKKDFVFVVNDDKTCYAVSDFQNAEAQKYATQWFEAQQLLDQQQAKLETDRDTYSEASKSKRQSMKATILQEEKDVMELKSSVKTLEKLIRKHELSKR